MPRRGRYVLDISYVKTDDAGAYDMFVCLSVCSCVEVTCISRLCIDVADDDDSTIIITGHAEQDVQEISLTGQHSHLLPAASPGWAGGGGNRAPSFIAYRTYVCMG